MQIYIHVYTSDGRVVVLGGVCRLKLSGMLQVVGDAKCVVKDTGFCHCQIASTSGQL